MASNAGRAVGCRAPSRPCRPRIGLKRRPGCWVPGSVPTMPAKDWPQTPARLLVAGLRPDHAGQGLASNAGQAVGCRAPSRPCRSKMASNAGRAGVCRAPSRPCRSMIGLKRRPGCQVRGSSGTWVGRGRAGVPPHKLHGAGSIGARRPSVQFAAGAPRHDPTPRSRTRPTAGEGIRPSPIQGLSTATTVKAFARHKDPSGTALSSPTGGTTPTRRKGGDGSGCPRSKLHTRPP